MNNDNLRQILGNRQSEDAPQGEHPVHQGNDGGDMFGPERDFRTAAISSEQQLVRKSMDQGDPYTKPFKISRVYEIAPVGGAAVQYTAVASEGSGRFSEQLDFQAHTLLLDNYSPLWVYVPGAKRFLAPWQINVVWNIPGGTSTIDVRFISPPAVGQTGSVVNAMIAVQAYEGMLAPSAGYTTPASAIAQAINIIQAAGLTLAGGGATQFLGDRHTFDGSGGAGTLALPVAAYPLLRNPANSFDRSASLSSVGDGIGVSLASQPSSAPLSTISGANAAVTNTYTAVAGQSHRLTHRGSSYNAAATGRLTISDGATVIEDYDISAAGPTSFPPLPPGGIKGTVNTAMTVTLQAGGAAVIGRVNSAKLTA